MIISQKYIEPYNQIKEHITVSFCCKQVCSYFDKQNSILEMSLKVNIQTSIQIAYLDFKQLNKIGCMQYCISLYYLPKNSQQKIHFIATHIDKGKSSHKQQANNQPYNDTYYSYSRKFQVNYLNEPIQDNTFYFFKVYVDEALLNKVDFYINIDLLLSPSFKSKFSKAYHFEACIRKPTNLFTFLPICFDQFGSLSISASYHSALMQYKFQKIEDESTFLQKQYPNLNSYIQKVTVGYRKSEIIAFYNKYRRLLQNELLSLQERYNQYGKLSKNHQKKCMFTKLNQNKKILKLSDHLHELGYSQIPQELKDKLSQFILQDIMNIKELLYKNWNEFNELVKINHKYIIHFLKHRYEQHLKKRLSANLMSNLIVNHDWTFNKYGNNSKSHLQQAQFLRKEAQQQNWSTSFPIENLKFFEEKSKAIKIFEDVYEISNLLQAKPVPQDYQHIVVLVHGYQAHRNDMIEMKLCLQAKHKLKAFISSSNIGKTDECIDNMGKRLAFEVSKYVQILKKPYKLSFIGHSMGGIIIRSAVQYLNSQGQNILSKLHAYISICTPHLGYLYSSSTLVQAGLWLMNTIQKSESMLQLAMKDHLNLKQTYLYKLAAQKQLNHFSKIAFLASSQDEYVQYESSRVEKNVIALTEKSNKKLVREVICEMVDNLLCEVQADKIRRLDVIFNIDSKTFDSFIGRTGHVKFLCDPQFLKHFSICLDHLFA